MPSKWQVASTSMRRRHEEKLLSSTTEQLLSTVYDKDKDGDFEEGDILVEEYWDVHEPHKVHLVRNSRQVPRKYIVVHRSPSGIPYVRELNAKGKPIGMLFLPHRLAHAYNFGLESITGPSLLSFAPEYRCRRFVLDSGQLDAILLDEEFDATAEMREKSKLFQDIKVYNKSIILNTWYGTGPEELPKKLKPGDKLWSSTTKFFVVQKVTINHSTSWLVETIDSNMKAVSFTYESIRGRRLYISQPRSYTQEAKN